jgi:hypothetical protein
MPTGMPPIIKNKSSLSMREKNSISILQKEVDGRQGYIKINGWNDTGFLWGVVLF